MWAWLSPDRGMQETSSRARSPAWPGKQSRDAQTIQHQDAKTQRHEGFLFVSFASSSLRVEILVCARCRKNYIAAPPEGRFDTRRFLARRAFFGGFAPAEMRRVTTTLGLRAAATALRTGLAWPFVGLAWPFVFAVSGTATGSSTTAIGAGALISGSVRSMPSSVIGLYAARSYS